MDRIAWLRELKGPKDLFAGLIYIVVGSGAFVMAHAYDMGTPLQMGPGFYPALVGVVLVLLGIGSVIIGLRRKEADPIEKINIEPLLLILVGTISFSFLIERAGLVVAIAALLFFACFRRLLSHPLEILAVFVVLATFSVLVFINAFGMPIEAFWWQQ